MKISVNSTIKSPSDRLEYEKGGIQEFKVEKLDFLKGTLKKKVWVEFVKSLVFHEKAKSRNTGIEVQGLYSKGTENIFNAILKENSANLG